MEVIKISRKKNLSLKDFKKILKLKKIVKKKFDSNFELEEILERN